MWDCSTVPIREGVRAEIGEKGELKERDTSDMSALDGSRTPPLSEEDREREWAPGQWA